MSADTDNAMLGRRLRAACGNDNVKLPSAIIFTSYGATVLMHLDSFCVEANMQENAAAFEGWALALKRWLPEITQVELRWNFTGVDSDPHYQRFLYRAKNFQSLFQDWFAIAPANTAEFGRLKTEAAGHEFILNVASKPRALEPAGESDCLGCAQLSEHKLECHIVRNQEPLCKLLGIDSLDRQLPVGLFSDRVSAASANEIFPRRHSAIDLWGVNKGDRTLFLFELKKRGNIPLGIMSELFFYAFVMADVQAKRFSFEKPNLEIQATETIAAYILAPEWHPLIDGEMLAMVNGAFSKCGQGIRFGAVKIVPEEVEKYRVVDRA
jgi:hypothetical protein